jgi:D-lactate dehydrogenase
MHDVFFYEAFAEEAAALHELLPSQIAAGYTDATIQEANHDQPPARLISVRTQSRIPAAWAPSLDAILTRSTGYDHLQAYAAAVDRPPQLGYLPLYCHRAVAEQAALMWLALLRKLPQQLTQFATFHRDGLTGGECLGRILVVVGVGYIGHEVCRIGSALGMRVLGVDIDPRYNDVEYADVDAALPQADVIVCAMDLNAANRGYFDSKMLGRAKRGAIFVNVSRGELSPSTALLQALRSGQLGGVALDVYEHEQDLAVALRSGQTPADVDARATLELSKLDNVLCTPHNAFNTAEAVRRKSDHSVRQILAFRKSGRFEWEVPLGT